MSLRSTNSPKNLPQDNLNTILFQTDRPTYVVNNLKIDAAADFVITLLLCVFIKFDTSNHLDQCIVVRTFCLINIPKYSLLNNRLFFIYPTRLLHNFFTRHLFSKYTFLI
jgi:hypothetical protein